MTVFSQKVLAIKAQEGLTGEEVSVCFGIASVIRWNKCLETVVFEQNLRYEPAVRLEVSQRVIGNALKRLIKNTLTSKIGQKRTAYLPGQDQRVSD